MDAASFRVGDRVVITAKDDFYSYVDGWRGAVAGLNNGLVTVHVPGKQVGPTGPTPLLTFFVPADQLALTV